MTKHAFRRVLGRPSERPGPSEMIVLLELLRFVAAVGVVIYHYQHFVTYAGEAYEPSRMPFGGVFSWFYRHGGTGVQVFWLLSGTVFAHVYQKGLLDGDITVVDFSRKRIARLYPLHLVTLFVVGVLMFAAGKLIAYPYVIYSHNDLKHFVLNLFFAQYWGIQSGTSFNGPSWSVSIEIVAYLVFLFTVILLRELKRFSGSPLSFSVAWTVVLFAMIRSAAPAPGYIYTCILLFFVGALIYSIWSATSDVLVAVLISACVVEYKMKWPISNYLVQINLPFGALCMGLILSLLSLSRIACRPQTINRMCLRLGSLTYSIYLLHFPIQILLILWSEKVVKIDFLTSGSFAVFFAILISSSLLCHDWFEEPAKRLFLRLTDFQKRV